MCHVLVIEDEWMIAEYIAVLATDGGATSVAIATSESDAVQAAHDHKPSIILSDVNLLEGTGPSAVAAIILEYGPIPVVFITASPEGCQSFEAPHFVLGKPVSPAAMIEAFRQHAPL